IQDELGILAQEPGRIEAQREITRNAARRHLVDDRLRVAVDPPTLHALLRPRAAGRSAILHRPRREENYLLPMMRRDHQPVRRGPLSAAGPVSISGLGSSTRLGRGGGGATGASPEPMTKGAGSRTVERRRGCSGGCSVGCATAGCGAGDDAAGAATGAAAASSRCSGPSWCDGACVAP